MLTITFENVNFIFKSQFIPTRGDFSCFFCLEVFDNPSLGSLLIKNSSINIFHSKEIPFTNHQQNFSIFELRGPRFMLKLENLSFFLAGHQIFKNLIVAIPLNQEVNRERGIIMKNIRFLGELYSTVLTFNFSDTDVKMNVVAFENIKLYEIIGFNSEIAIEKSKFYLKYSADIADKGTVFLKVEKSKLFLEEFILEGDKEDASEIYCSYGFMSCQYECKITMKNIFIQNIFLDKVLKRF